jgi:citrate lyase subunit beta/citryl-CoA lyase
MRPYRSMLFVPGHRDDWVDKAVRARPDAIVLDLEDSVPTERKTEAREIVAASIERLRQNETPVGLFVRPNAFGTGLTGLDLEVVVCPGLSGVFAPKIEQASEVLRYEALIDHFEIRNSTEGIELIVPMETARAIATVTEIAAASQRIGSIVGSTAEHADVAREVGFEWTEAGLETLYIRSKVLLACRAAGVHAMTGLWEDIQDLEGLAHFAQQSRQIGFRGMICIHPSHVAAINAAFTPGTEAVEFHRGLVEAYQAAETAGHGATVYRGVHIDKAREVLARADQIAQFDDAGWR